MDAKQKLEVSLRAAVIIKDLSQLVDCDNIDCMVNDFSRAVSRMFELDKMLNYLKENESEDNSNDKA